MKIIKKGQDWFHIEPSWSFFRLPPGKTFAKPVDKADKPAGEDAIEDNRTSDGEDFTADSKDLAFFFVFDSRSGYAVGKASDRN